MKKLTVLKSIIDLFWIVSLPLIPVIFIFIGFVFYDDSLDGQPIRFLGIDFEIFDYKAKALFIASLISYLVLMY